MRGIGQSKWHDNSANEYFLTSVMRNTFVFINANGVVFWKRETHQWKQDRKKPSALPRCLASTSVVVINKMCFQIMLISQCGGQLFMAYKPLLGRIFEREFWVIFRLELESPQRFDIVYFYFYSRAN
jgi:hypothetical protein